MSLLILKVKLLSEHATLPSRATRGSAGYDLAAAHMAMVPRHGKTLVQTDLALAIPPGHYGRIAPRSGLALKHHIDVGAGVIDSDYRGPVGVVLFNHGPEDFHIQKGDRIAQLILEQISVAQVEEVDELVEGGERGAGGFGSTGI